MTPLAQALLRDRLRPPADRTFRAPVSERTVDPFGVADALLEARCFDLDEVVDEMDALAVRLSENRDRGADKLAFLPAPVTWIEWRHSGSLGNRAGFLLVEHRGGEGPPMIEIGRTGGVISAAMHLAFVVECHSAAMRDGSREFLSSPIKEVLPLGAGNPAYGTLAQPGRGAKMSPDEKTTRAFILYAALALINSPKLVGRTEHPPHRGLARDLRRGGIAGTLLPWHRIHLGTSEFDAARAEERRLEASGAPAGGRARHFCRAHLRVRRGQLEIVRAHWRGSAEFGQSQASYRLRASSALARLSEAPCPA